jgi:2-polyprenyl-6-methoxyphenol hydroxylase-like FAD-dependent oxidoreductase
MEFHADILIAGGGPAGLYLAGRLLQNGISCVVLEKKTEIDHHSKSLGIHPVSLDIFDKAGISNHFLEKGLKIKQGIAFWNLENIGTISFESCPKPHNYILAIPQWQTEEILEGWVRSLNPGCLIRGANVTAIRQNSRSVSITFKAGENEQTLTGRFGVACDGKKSLIRKSLQIPYYGGSYPDSYIMGDFSDNTSFGSDAAVFLHKDGLIESFPLPDGNRRWVVKTDSFIQSPSPNNLIQLLYERIAHDLSSQNNFMVSSFGVQHYLAGNLHKGRFLLAGDAAHIVSPIGGQGMNLGWIDAEACVKMFTRILQKPAFYSGEFQIYSNRQRKIAKQAARRAAVNMWLGRKENSGRLIKLTARLITKKPFSRGFARVFTMRGLGKWPL